MACSHGKRSRLSARVRELSANKQRTIVVRPFVFLGMLDGRTAQMLTVFPAQPYCAKIV
jgi:hypothetical protein